MSYFLEKEQFSMFSDDLQFCGKAWSKLKFYQQSVSVHYITNTLNQKNKETMQTAYLLIKIV